MSRSEPLSGSKELNVSLGVVLAGTTGYIYMLDRDLRILYASPEALRAMKRTEDQLVGKKFGALGIPLESVSGHEDLFNEALDKGRPNSADVSYMTTEGRRFFAYDVVPVLDREGNADRLVVTARDITAWKSAEVLGEVLNRIYAAINSTMSLDEIMRRVMAVSSEVMDSEAIAIALKEGDRWVLRFGHGKIPPNALGASLTDQQMRSCFLRSDGCTAGVVDVNQADWVSQEMMRRFQIESFISVPLSVRSAVIGVLIFAFTRPRSFSAEELDFGTKLSSVISLALENANLYRQERDRRFLLQTILDDTPAVIILIDGRELSIKWANRFSDRYKMGPLRTESTVGMSLDSIIPNVEKTGVAEMFRRVIASGRPFYDSEFMLSGLGEEVIYWSGALVPMQSAEAETPDLLILAVDVTSQVRARKRSEELAQAAEEERERLQTIMDTLPVGVELIDRSGRITTANHAAKGLWGSILPSLTDINDLEKVQAWTTDSGRPLRFEDWGVVKAIYGGKGTQNEMVTLKRYDGQEIVLLMSSTPLTDGQKKVIGAVSISQDITRQQQVQREAMESTTRAELYVDLLTHDINNLNTAAMGYLQLLDAESELGEKEKRWTARSLEALEESSRLIENIRGIQMLESGLESLSIFSLDDVLRKLVADLADHPSRQIDIRLVSRGEHCVLSDQLVKEIFANLVDNSIKHSSGPLDVEIRVSTVFETGKEYHRIDIEDTGPGISDQVKDKIFTRAWQGRTKAVGKGLGLFLVRRLVEDLDGRVWVEDRVLGDHTKGARFVVLLPAVDCRGP